MESIKVDATKKILGRLASDIAKALLGKTRPDFSASQTTDTRIVVTHTDDLAVSGKKLSQKLYRHHSGFHGGLKEKKLGVLFKEDSREVLRRAVWGMLPKNKLRRIRIKNLILYKGGEIKKAKYDD